MGAVPADLLDVVERHGRAVAAGDNAAVLADFRPDRVGQLIASARPPEAMQASEVLSVEPGPGALFTAHIRYRGREDDAVFRSRWTRIGDRWLVTQVRNVPDTPPPPSSVGPSDDGLDGPHWAGLAREELRIQHCPRCGTWIWAPQPLCPSCHHTQLEWPAVEPVGTVYSWTRTWQPFHPSVSGHLPYVVVAVELPAAGNRRLLGALLAADGADVRIGRRVEAVFDSVLRWRLEDS
ncbi:MAG: uncharacterized protein QOJ30_3110 [Pseudonocardiales bacterium]|jgi:hypothetical protein|nr:uncharacterized protein [Pseudonocardiales bacterium]